MNVIQEIAGQTTHSTEATAKSIADLAEMSNEMRVSVEGFTLPGENNA
jgi:twitching motility protein PilJ